MTVMFRPAVGVLQQRRAEAVSPLAHLFPTQQAVVADPAKFKALLCGRRAGKTGAALYDLAHGMLAERSLNLYVALTLSSAREILWEPMRRANDAHKWGLTFDESKHIVKAPNGSRLLVRGADDRRELEKLRGPAFKRIRIDECGAHRPSYLQYVVEEVLEATLMDCDGDVWLMGTPTTQAFGFFYELTCGQRPGYSVHHWTAEQNPHVDYQRFIHDPVAGLLVRRNWTVDHPIFRREYLAEWVIDSERLVYRFGRERNVVRDLPELLKGDVWEHILAMDFGVNHKTAAAVIAYPKRWGRDCYIVDSWGQSGLAPSEAADRIATTHARWRPVATVGDAGGIGAAFIKELSNRHPGIAMRPALKAEKRSAMEFFSDALYTAVPGGDQTQRRGLMLVDGATHELQRQLGTLQWDEQRMDVASGQDDDEAHAALYAYRYTPAYANAERPDPIPESDIGTTWEFKAKPKFDVSPERAALAANWNRRR